MPSMALLPGSLASSLRADKLQERCNKKARLGMNSVTPSVHPGIVSVTVLLVRSSLEEPMEHLHAFFALVTANPVGRFVMMIAPIGLIVAVLRLLFFSRKIQPNGFRWTAIRNELVFAAINTSLTGVFLGGLTALLNKYHLIRF